uniref:hypothetical protein n=1 Tax=uncultured Sphingomonas sp. TaxID=158754 RepID=UPI0035CB49BA
MKLYCVALASTLLATTAVAQSSPEPLPANYIRVTAPLAQRLTTQLLAAHPEIKKLGLHATPVGATDNAIIGSDTPGKIGKKSSAPDMVHLASGKDFVTRIDKDGIYDLLLPITDRKGKSIGDGFIVTEVPIDKVAGPEEALKIGAAIRDEMERLIPSKAALYK